MSDDGALLSVTAALINTIGDQEVVVIEFVNIDEKWGLPEGSTAKHIDEAAKIIRYDVQEKSATHARLRRNRDFSVA